MCHDVKHSPQCPFRFIARNRGPVVLAAGRAVTWPARGTGTDAQAPRKEHGERKSAGLLNRRTAGRRTLDVLAVPPVAGPELAARI